MSIEKYYILLLVVGLFMLGLETIVPGGILGVVGVVALIAALVIGFGFPAPWGLISALGILLLTGLTLYIWVKYFPKTMAGRVLTLSDDTKTAKSHKAQPELLGKEGVAATTLRPSGIVLIDGKRVDVVAEGNWIEQDTLVKVIRVQGNLITVRQTADS